MRRGGGGGVVSVPHADDCLPVRVKTPRERTHTYGQDEYLPYAASRNEQVVPSRCSPARAATTSHSLAAGEPGTSESRMALREPARLRRRKATTAAPSTRCAPPAVSRQQRRQPRQVARQRQQQLLAPAQRRNEVLETPQAAEPQQVVVESGIL